MSKYFAILTYVESFYYIKLRFPEEAGVRKKKKREGHRNVSEHEQHFYFHFKGSFWSEKLLEAYFSLNE